MLLYRLLSRRFGAHERMTTGELLRSRREALKLTLAASAGLLLSDRGLASARRGKGRVVVIGAGLAGLSCAYELRAAGHDVVVLEARPRVGGRVTSFRDLAPGKIVEAGGEFIGSNHPVWARYAQRFGLEFMDVPDEKYLDHPLRLKGRTLASDEARRVWEQMRAALAGLTKGADRVDFERPWKTANAVGLDATHLGAWLAESGVDELTGAALRADLQGLNGVALEKASLLAMLAIIRAGGLEKYWTDSEAFRCRGGASQLADRLASAIGRESVVLRAPVVGITRSSKGCVVRRQDGTTHECDLAVVATPPTMWRRLTWEPELLPPEFNMTMGLASKYLAVLRERVWESDKRSQYALGDGALSGTWEATAGQPKPEDAETDRIVLTGFSAGPGAEGLGGVNSAERVMRLNAELEQLQPRVQAAFLTSRFVNWPGESWTFGGYSFPEPGLISRSGEAIDRGFGPVRFCGEHLSYGFCGYMEGALQSGTRLAERLNAELG